MNCADSSRLARSGCEGLWLLVLGLGSLALFGSLSLYGLNLGEEGATVRLFGRTAQGEIPYIDFISGYTPGYFYFHAALLRWFGDSVLVVRWPLVGVHTANVLLLYWIGRAFLPRRWASVAALAYPASLPVVEVSEVSFNVPYPAWYTLLFLMLGYLVAGRVQARGRLGWWLAAGALAGLSFSFKPNSGLFHLSFVVLAVCVGAAAGQPPGWPWVFPRFVVLCVLGAIAAVLRHHWASRELLVFFLPLCATMGASLARATNTGSVGSAVSPLGPALCAVGLGFAAVTLPWLLWWGWQLGLERFLHDVLFIGTGYERFFYEPYRALPGQVGLAMFVAGVAWWFLGKVHASPVMPRLAWIVLAVALVAGLSRTLMADMPEGFVAAATSAYQSAAFLLVPAVHAWTSLHLWQRSEGQDPSSKALSVLALAAQCSWLNAYPRSDFFHVAYAAPLSGVLLAYALRQYALRASALWSRAARTAGGRVVWTGVVGLLVVIAVPHLRLAGRVLVTTLGFDAGLERLAVPGAPVLIQRGPGGNRQREFAATVAYLRHEAAGREEWLLTFPDLELVTFLSGLRSPARIGYFKAGWPAHEVEAEVLDAVRERKPRWVVSEEPVSLFFYDAPAYFFLLRDWVAHHYRPLRRFGTFVVFERVDESATEDRREERHGEEEMPPSRTDASRIEPACSRAALRRVREEGRADMARSWAKAWARQGRGTWPVGCARFALRVLGEVGDPQVARDLFRAGEPGEPSVAREWHGALWNLALRSVLRRFHWGASEARRGERQAWSELERGERERLGEWLSSPQAGARRFVAAWALAASGEAHAVPLPSGEDLLDRLSRAVLSVEGEDDGALWVEILGWVDELPNLLPALFLSWAENHRERAVQVWVDAYQGASASDRVTLAYLASVLASPRLCAWLEAEQERDPAEAVRRALAWSHRALRQRGVCTLGDVSR